MENASKALLMAASVLLGVMLISIGAYLFSVYGDYTSSMYDRIESAQIDQFNIQFLKYYGERQAAAGSGTEKVLCTAHDIASLANLARKNNLENEVAQDRNRYDLNLNKQANTSYIQIRVKSEGTVVTGGIRANDLTNLEAWNDETKMLQFIQSNSLHDVYTYDAGVRKIEKQAKRYICTKALVSDITKRVYYMEFQHIKVPNECVTCN